MYRRILSLAAFASVLAVPAGIYAQAYPDARHGFGGTPNFELYGGYSYVFKTYNPNSTSTAVTGRNGWDASLKVPIFGSFLGIKGDVSGSYLNNYLDPNLNPRSLTFLLGPQVGVHLGRSTLFAHGMVGSAHLSQKAIPNLRSDTDFCGGGGRGARCGLVALLCLADHGGLLQHALSRDESKHPRNPEFQRTHLHRPGDPVLTSFSGSLPEFPPSPIRTSVRIGEGRAP